MMSALLPGSTQLYTIAIAFGCITVICSVVMVIAMVRNSSISTDKMNPTVLYLTHGSMGSSIIAMLFFVAGCTYYVLLSHTFAADLCIWLFSLCYATSRALMYSVFVYRLHVLLRHYPKYALTKRIYIFFIFMVFAYFFFYFLLNVWTYSNEMGISQLSDQELSILSISNALSRQIILSIVNVYLIVLLGSRMLNITIDLDNGINYNAEFEEKRRLMMRVTTLCVLVLFATLPTGMHMIMRTIYYFENDLFAQYWLFTPMLCCGTNICLYLLLDANRNKYAMICGPCDAQITKCCLLFAAKKSVERRCFCVQSSSQNYTNGDQRSYALQMSVNFPTINTDDPSSRLSTII